LENAGAKALRTAGESLVKPAAVKIARIMCSEAAAQGCATKQQCRPNEHITRLVHGPQLHVSSSAAG